MTAQQSTACHHAFTKHTCSISLAFFLSFFQEGKGKTKHPSQKKRQPCIRVQNFKGRESPQCHSSVSDTMSTHVDRMSLVKIHDPTLQLPSMGCHGKEGCVVAWLHGSWQLENWPSPPHIILLFFLKTRTKLWHQSPQWYNPPGEQPSLLSMCRTLCSMLTQDHNFTARTQFPRGYT